MIPYHECVCKWGYSDWFFQERHLQLVKQIVVTSNAFLKKLRTVNLHRSISIRNEFQLTLSKKKCTY